MIHQHDRDYWKTWIRRIEILRYMALRADCPAGQKPWHML